MFRIMDEEAKEQVVREAEALEEFKKELKDTIAAGAGDWKTAMRWLMEADDIPSLL